MKNFVFCFFYLDLRILPNQIEAFFHLSLSLHITGYPNCPEQ